MAGEFFIVLFGLLLFTALGVNFVVIPVNGDSSITEFSSYNGVCKVKFFNRIRGDFLPVSWSEDVSFSGEECVEVLRHEGDYSYKEFLGLKEGI